MGSKSLRNAVFGSGMIDYPYFDPSHTFLVLQETKQWSGHFFGVFRAKNLTPGQFGS